MGGGGDGKIEETELEKAQAQTAVKRWGDYQNLFKPYENKFMGEVDGLNSEAKYQQASDLATSPLANQFAQEGLRMQKEMGASGINPNSGKRLSFESEVSGAQASAEVDASARANETQQDRYVGGLSNVVAMGQGQAGQAMAGMTDVAVSAQSNARQKAQNSLSGRNTIREGVGLGVGAVTRYGLDQSKPDTNNDNGGG